METPTRAELARFDRSRKNKKTSNKEWKSPQDPDAKIAKMKDGRTHLAHKAEHGVDMDTGAIVSVTVQDASDGDTATLPETLIIAAEQVEAVQPEGAGVEEVVADKGYHSDETLVGLGEDGLGHVAQVLLGMVDVDDFDGAWKLLGGDVPNPWSAVADDDLTGRGVEAAPLRLAIDTLCEGGRLRAGVAAGRALDRGVVADRPGVTDRPALRVAPFGRPHGVHTVASLTSRVLAEPSGLLPATPFDLGRPHRHARAVHPEVQRGRARRCGLLGDGALVLSDLASERLGNALDLPGLDFHPG